MKTFSQFLQEKGIELNEKGKRTALGIYPPAYGVAQRPPLDFAPTSAGHYQAFTHIHGDVHKDLLSPDAKKDWEENKKKGKKESKKKKSKKKDKKD